MVAALGTSEVLEPFHQASEQKSVQLLMEGLAPSEQGTLEKLIGVLLKLPLSVR